MQQFALNQEEIAHIRELRSLPLGEREAIVQSAHALSLTHPHLTVVQPAIVVQLTHRTVDA